MNIYLLKMFKFSLILSLVSSVNLAFSQNCSELFFSEYIEGGSNNKAVEIYNPTNSDINLSTYSVKIVINGGTSTNTIALSGILKADSVFVITHTSAVPALKDSADLTTGSLAFNGDDAVLLLSATDTVDVIGVIGVDPGSDWSGSGASTQNQTLIRMASVQIGVGPDSTNFDPSIQWNNLPQDDFSNIGVHTSSCHTACVATSSQITDSICEGGSYTFNDTTLTTSGVYFDTIQNAGGCDSIIELTFTVNSLPTIGAGMDQSITSGSSVTLMGTGGVSYTWNNAVVDGVAFMPTSTMDYIVTGTDASGCENTDTVAVVVQTISNNTGNCSELFFSEYIEGGGNNKALEIYNPSTSTIDLSNYSVILFQNGSPNAFLTIPLSGMLSGDSVFVITNESANASLLSAADLTEDSLIFNGDDAIALVTPTDTLDVIGVIGVDPGSAWVTGGVSTQNQTLVRMTTVQIGVGAGATAFEPSLEWNNLPQDDFTNIGMHTSSCPRCTSDTTQLIDSICAGESYIFNNMTLTTSGIYYDTILNAGGCDSVLVLTFTVNDLPTITGTVSTDTICESDSVTFNGQGGLTYSWNNGVTDGIAFAPTSTMDYVVTGMDAKGCLNYDTLTVLVNLVDSVSIADTICEGDSLVFGSQTLTAGGVYFETYSNSNGCDSVVQLVLVVKQLPVIMAMVSQDTVCIGQDITLFGQGGVDYIWDNNVTDNIATSISQTTTFIVLGEDANGCLNTDTITVVVSTDSVPEILIFTTDSLLCEGEGTSFSSLVANVGQNVSYQWMRNGNDVGTGLATYNSQSSSTNDGDVITCEITSVNSCATTVMSNSITISVRTPDTVALTQSICSGDTLILGTQQLTVAGNYSETLQNMNGCDSVVNLELIVNATESILVRDTICEGTNYMFGGVMIEQSGTYFDSLQTSNGCDSLVALILVVKPIERTTINEFICTGDSVLFGGNQIMVSGTYVDTLMGVNGCDSIATLQLIVGATDTLMTSDIICSGDSVVFGSQTLTSSGIYTENFPSVGGCDSIVSLELVVVNSSSSQLSDTICAGDSIEFAGQQLTTSGTYFNTILNQAGCDSVVEFTLVVNEKYMDTITQTLCMGDSIVFGGVTYNQTGVYTNALQTMAGCDSIITLDLRIKMTDSVTINESICNGSSYVLGTQTITQPGSYIEVFQSSLGCDSVVTAIIGFGNSTDTTVVEEICQGEFYEFGGQFLTSTGTYIETFTNASGCDSMVTLTLSVKVNPIVSITQAGEDLISTQGDAYQWFFNGDTIQGATDQIYTPIENGIYTVEMTAFNGCSDLNNYTFQNVSIDELGNIDLSVTPNPSNGIYKIAAKTNFSYVVYNLLGEIVTSSSIEDVNQNIDLTLEENGVYILKVITANNKVVLERLVKN